MKIKKNETRTTYACVIDGQKYVRTYIDWNDERPIEISWHLNEDQIYGVVYLEEKELEERFQLNNYKVIPSELEVPTKRDKVNLLEEFFSEQHSEWKLFQQDQQFQLEQEFEKWYEERSKNFDFCVNPAIRFLLKHWHPMTSIIISYSTAILVESEQCHNLDNEIPD